MIFTAKLILYARVCLVSLFTFSSPGSALISRARNILRPVLPRAWQTHGAFSQQGVAAERFRNTLAWSALQASNSCRKFLAGLQALSSCPWQYNSFRRIWKGWTVLSPVYLALGWCWCKPKQAQGAIKRYFCFLLWKNFHFHCVTCESLLCRTVIVKEICSSSACHSYSTRKGL